MSHYTGQLQQASCDVWDQLGLVSQQIIFVWFKGLLKRFLLKIVRLGLGDGELFLALIAIEVIRSTWFDILYSDK